MHVLKSYPRQPLKVIQQQGAAKESLAQPSHGVLGSCRDDHATGSDAEGTGLPVRQKAGRKKDCIGMLAVSM